MNKVSKAEWGQIFSSAEVRSCLLERDLSTLLCTLVASQICRVSLRIIACKAFKIWPQSRYQNPFRTCRFIEFHVQLEFYYSNVINFVFAFTIILQSTWRAFLRLRLVAWCATRAARAVLPVTISQTTRQVPALYSRIHARFQVIADMRVISVHHARAFFDFDAFPDCWALAEEISVDTDGCGFRCIRRPVFRNWLRAERLHHSRQNHRKV